MTHESWIVARMTRAGRPYSLVYPALMSLGVSVLASCAGQWPYSPPQTSAVRQPEPRAPWVSPLPSAGPRPIRKPNSPPAIDIPPPEAGGRALATEPEPGLPAPGPTANASPPPGLAATSPQSTASELIGLDQPAATRLLGAAAEHFEKPPAMVWRYKTATCELDLFFYLDLRSGQMRTLHYAFKGNDADTARRQNCLRSLVAARGG